MRRDFGSVSFDRSPVQGYPRYRSERHNVPLPPPGGYPRQRPISYEDPEIDPSYAPEVEVALGNPELPIYAYRNEIKQAVRDNQITIVVGETGSGKSTQMTQILLEDGYDKIYLTQPRIIATYNIAERTQEELSDALGPKAEGLVGYQTADHSTITEASKIIVLTDGIEAVRQLNEQPLDSGTVHILDEVHEWNTNIELTVAIVRKRIAENPEARFVLTSATIDAHRLGAFFAEVTGKMPPIIEVPGRTYGIERLERPDSTVIDEIVKSATESPDKDILAFVAGKREIGDIIDALHEQLPPDILKKATILPLHARLTKEEQDRIKLKSEGIRIIVSTNVAQTSLTIDGIDVVIDSGEARQEELDSEGSGGLKRHSVSQADCDQRAGRTGRLGPGTWILTRPDKDSRYVPYVTRDKYPTAEILRTDIDRTVLRTASVGIDLAQLALYHRIDKQVIAYSKEALRMLGAVDADGKITPMGQRMNDYPVRPSLGRMMVESSRYSPYTRAFMTAIVASQEVGGLPYFAYNVGREWTKLVGDSSSDLMAQLDIFIAIQNMDEREMSEYNLDVRNVRKAQKLYRRIANKAGAFEGPLPPPRDNERDDLKQCIYSGMLDFVYEYAGSGKYERIQSRNKTLRELSNRSVVTGSPRLVVGSPYVVEITKRTGVEERHIIEGVTRIDDPAALGKIAVHLCEWRPTGRAWRRGLPVQIVRQFFKGIDLGPQQEIAVEPSPALRQELIKYVLQNSGTAKQHIMAIKKELEDLQQLTTQSVPQLTQDQILEWLEEVTPEDIVDPSLIEHRLRMKIQDEEISLDSFIPLDERENIRLNAPSTITTPGGTTLKLIYKKGVPTVTRIKLDVILALENELYLEDGRQINYVYEKTAYSLSELKAKLAG